MPSRVDELIYELSKTRGRSLDTPTERELIALASRLEVENAKLRAALEQVEWVWVGSQNQNEPADLICPWCKQRKGHPWHRDQDVDHTPDCARQSALRRSEGE